LQPDNQVRCEFFKQFGSKTELLENKEKRNLERAMGIELHPKFLSPPNQGVTRRSVSQLLPNVAKIEKWLVTPA
jgi:hypothetical protein